MNFGSRPPQPTRGVVAAECSPLDHPRSIGARSRPVAGHSHALSKSTPRSRREGHLQPSPVHSGGCEPAFRRALRRLRGPRPRVTAPGAGAAPADAQHEKAELSTRRRKGLSDRRRPRAHRRPGPPRRPEGLSRPSLKLSRRGQHEKAGAHRGASRRAHRRRPEKLAASARGTTTSNLWRT